MWDGMPWGARFVQIISFAGNLLTLYPFGVRPRAESRDHRVHLSAGAPRAPTAILSIRRRITVFAGALFSQRGQSGVEPPNNKEITEKSGYLAEREGFELGHEPIPPLSGAVFPSHYKGEFRLEEFGANDYPMFVTRDV